MNRKLRILVLVHTDLVPPDDLEGYSDKEYQEWKTEFDVISTLRENGHEVRALGVYDDLGVIREAIHEFKPQIAFNLLEEFHDNSLFDHHIASFLELMRQPYTGCNPRGLMLAHDKSLTKKLLAYHKILIPRFTVVQLGRKPRMPKKCDFPLIVKSLYEEGSYGIAQASVVNSMEKLQERVTYLHEQLSTPAIVEEYIDGRELYIAVIGNRRLQTFPIIELVFGKMTEGTQKIATSRVKWDWKYQEAHGIDTVIARDLPDELEQRISRLARRMYRVLGLSGYARIDLRLTESGRLYVLEANANPDLGYGEELSCATEAAGMNYSDLLHKIMNLGLRYRPRESLR